jgi:hypothetical protein
VVSVARKLSTTEDRYQEQNCFCGKITETKVTNMKTIVGSSPGEDVWFRNNFFSVIFNVTYAIMRQ